MNRFSDKIDNKFASKLAEMTGFKLPEKNECNILSGKNDNKFSLRFAEKTEQNGEKFGGTMRKIGEQLGEKTGLEIGGKKSKSECSASKMKMREGEWR